MLQIECEGCSHDMQGHCLFWGIAVAEVTDRECAIAKARPNEQFNPLIIKKNP
jgi:hypothetical protein